MMNCYYYFLLLCVSKRVQISMCSHASVEAKGQRYGAHSLPPLWVLGTEFKTSGLNKCLCPGRQLAYSLVNASFQSLSSVTSWERTVSSRAGSFCSHRGKCGGVLGLGVWRVHRGCVHIWCCVWRLCLGFGCACGTVCGECMRVVCTYDDMYGDCA